MILGLQLYGPVAHNKMEMSEFFKGIRNIGIDRVEPCISLDGKTANPSFWTMEQVEKYFPMLKETGLEVISCHVISENLNESIPEMCKLADEYGIRQFVVSIGELTETALQERAFLLRKIADSLEGHGAELLLHNNKAEIACKIQGRSAYEYLVDICLGKLGMQFDSGWCARGGEDPVEFIKRNESRIKSFHYKDFNMNDDTDVDVRIGDGTLDNEMFMQFARLKGIPQFIDGPEYSPDGRHIWFISTRSGLMQVYRMNSDGTDVKQMTFEDCNNWFGHVSPDGKKVVNISYRKGDLHPREHLPNMQVALWMMDYDGANRRKLFEFFGGQGSINVNSWSGDSRYFAFVSYDIQVKR